MKWTHVFRRAERLAQNEKDLQFHLEAETEENQARGMSHEEAYSAARTKLGNPTSLREDVYRMNSFNFLESVWQDLLYSLRMMRKSVVFTMTIVTTLAVGIGGNTAGFSVINAVLLKPLQYRDPDRLVQITADYPRRDDWDTTFTKQKFDDVKAVARSFTASGTFLPSQETLVLSGGGEPEVLKGARVSANFLEILGIRPTVGRGFLPEEEQRGGPPVAIISDQLWKRRFNGDSRILIENLLFHVHATDAATFVSTALLFVVVALAASFIPARRASLIDPMIALRAG